MTDIPPPVKKDPRTVARKFVDAFLSEARPKAPPLPNPNEGGVGTEDDLFDYATPEFVEASRSEPGKDGEGEAEPVRTISNALDFLGEIGEELIEAAIGRESDPSHTPRQKEKPYAICTDAVPPHTWKATRYWLSNTIAQLARKTEERRSMTLVNYGPDPVFISDESGTGFGSQPNTFTLPVSARDGSGPWSPVTLNTQDEVWGRSLNGSTVTPSEVEVLETFSRPEERD